MFRTVLIANRGEIAVRVMRTCREMGIATVAVYSDADRNARHVLEADRAVYLGAAAPSESYLNADRIIAAARETGAEAIHPGYGFLSEKATFAAACAEAGLVFIGPPPEAMRAMGSKIGARQLMQSSGVPVVPGETPADQSTASLVDALGRVGRPA
jgi:acetyl/propionyl-CoA carboxylase alpha subunit